MREKKSYDYVRLYKKDATRGMSHQGWLREHRALVCLGAGMSPSDQVTPGLIGGLLDMDI